MDSQRKRPRRNSQFAVEYLLGHPAASNEDVVKATGASPRSVTRARAMLVATGQLQRSYFDRQHRPAGPSEDEPGSLPASPSDVLLPVERPIDPAAMERALRDDHGPALDVEQMKRRYSAIARYAAKTGEFTLEITAMQALGRLESQTGARDRLGPGVPHTREDRRDRVKAILEAAGPSITAEAIVMAYDVDEFLQFSDELNKYVVRKVENEQQLAKNSPPDRDAGPLEGAFSASAVVEAEIGPRDGDVGGAEGADRSSTGRIAD